MNIGNLRSRPDFGTSQLQDEIDAWGEHDAFLKAALADYEPPTTERDDAYEDFSNSIGYLASAGLVDSLGGMRVIELTVKSWINHLQPDLGQGEKDLLTTAFTAFAASLGVIVEEVHTDRLDGLDEDVAQFRDTSIDSFSDEIHDYVDQAIDLLAAWPGLGRDQAVAEIDDIATGIEGVLLNLGTLHKLVQRSVVHAYADVFSEWLRKRETAASGTLTVDDAVALGKVGVSGPYRTYKVDNTSGAEPAVSSPRYKVETMFGTDPASAELASGRGGGGGGGNSCETLGCLKDRQCL